MQIEIEIIKTQKELHLHKGDVTTAFDVDVKSLGLFENKKIEERNEHLLDEDDDEYLDKQDDKPAEIIEGVETYLLVINRKREFVWIEANNVRAGKDIVQRAVFNKNGKGNKNNSGGLRRNTVQGNISGNRRTKRSIN